MRRTEHRPFRHAAWTTSIARIEPNLVEIAGHPIGELIGRRSLPEVTHLLIKQRFPGKRRLRELEETASVAAAIPPPAVLPIKCEDVAKTVARHLLADEQIARRAAEDPDTECGKALFCVGRVIRFAGSILGTGRISSRAASNEPFSHWLYRWFTDDRDVRPDRARMLEAMAVTCVDHGLTPPSTRACVLAASTRVPYEVAVAQGVAAMSYIHGGASGRSAEFFAQAVRRLRERGKGDLSDVLEELMQETLCQGRRVPGLGHRVHTADPRCEALWKVAEETGIAAECVSASRVASRVFSRVRGPALPINVDGVIGAIVADMALPPIVGTLVFVLGRVAGLSAHYFEEVRSFPAMRWIRFEDAVFRGK